jgi:hypothetical protein
MKINDQQKYKRKVEEDEKTLRNAGADLCGTLLRAWQSNRIPLKRDELSEAKSAPAMSKRDDPLPIDRDKLCKLFIHSSNNIIIF